MNDTPPFAPFQPQPILPAQNGPDQTNEKVDRRKGPRGPRKQTDGRRVGRPRTREVVGRAPYQTDRLSINLVTAISALAGLTEDDGKFIAGVVQAMEAFDGEQRQRIVRALGKLYP